MPQGISMADAATKQIGMQLHIAGRCQKPIHGTDNFGYSVIGTGLSISMPRKGEFNLNRGVPMEPDIHNAGSCWPPYHQ